LNRIFSAFVLVSIISIVTCTTLTPTGATPEQLQHQIIAENLLKPGDQVEIATSDGAVHKFRITEIDREAGLVLGEDKRVAIADIVAVKTREFSAGKTALLAGGATYGLWVWAMIIIAPIEEFATWYGEKGYS